MLKTLTMPLILLLTLTPKRYDISYLLSLVQTKQAWRLLFRIKGRERIPLDMSVFSFFTFALRMALRSLPAGLDVQGFLSPLPCQT